MMKKTSRQLEKTIVEILSPAQFTPSLYKVRYIFNSNDWEYEPDHLTGLSIKKDYMSTYFDHVALGFEAHPLDLIDMLTKTKDLYCTVMATPHSYRNFLPFEEDMFVERYKVIIENPEDLMKKLNLDDYEAATPEQLAELRRNDIRMPMDVQCIDEKIYDLRHTKINAVFGNGSTVEQAIQYAINAFTIDQVDMVTPDNTNAFDNLSIPPVHGLNSAFTYLQEAHGVYKKGLAIYYTDDTLYIWPPLELEPDMPNIVHIALAPTEMFEAMESYHYEEGEDICKIVSNISPETTQLTDSGPENVGTDKIVTNADKLIDHSGEMKPSGDYELTADRVSGAALSKDNIKYTDSKNVVPGGVTANIYTQSTEIAATNVVNFGTGWKGSSLVRFRPGQKVTVHYDNSKGEYTTQDGILTGVSYSMKRTDIKVHPTPFWIFNSTINALLMPPPDDEDGAPVSS